MNPLPATPATRDDPGRRQAANHRLAWVLAGVALALFLLAIWQFRRT